MFSVLQLFSFIKPFYTKLQRSILSSTSSFSCFVFSDPVWGEKRCSLCQVWRGDPSVELRENLNLSACFSTFLSFLLLQWLDCWVCCHGYCVQQHWCFVGGKNKTTVTSLVPQTQKTQTWIIQVFNFITLNFNRRSMLIIFIMCHQHPVSHQHRWQCGDDVTMRPRPQAAATHHLLFFI